MPARQSLSGACKPALPEQCSGFGHVASRVKSTHYAARRLLSRLSYTFTVASNVIALILRSARPAAGRQRGGRFEQNDHFPETCIGA